MASSNHQEEASIHNALQELNRPKDLRRLSESQIHWRVILLTQHWAAKRHAELSGTTARKCKHSEQCRHLDDGKEDESETVGTDKISKPSFCCSTASRERKQSCHQTVLKARRPVEAQTQETRARITGNPEKTIIAPWTIDQLYTFHKHREYYWTGRGR